VKITKSKLRQIIQEALEGGVHYDPEEKERVREWIQNGGTWRATPAPIGVRQFEDISSVALRRIIDELKTEGFVKELERDYYGMPSQGIEEMIKQITKEVLAEGPPLPVEHPALGDVARVAGIEQSARAGSFSRPPKLTDEQEERLSDLGYRLGSGGGLHWEDIGNLTAFYETQNKALPKKIDPDEIIAFLVNYPAFRDSYEQAGFDERDIEDRS